MTQDPFAAFDTAHTARALANVVRDVITHTLGSDSEARLFPLVDELELRGKGGVTRSKQLMEQRRFVLRYGEDYVVRVGMASRTVPDPASSKP